MSISGADPRKTGVLKANKRSAQWVLRLGGLSPWELTKRTFKDTRRDDAIGRAAQLSFYFILALFPLIVFACSVAALAVSNEQKFSQQLLNYLKPTMPDQVFSLTANVIHQVLNNPSHARLGFSLLFSIWSASYGVEALIDGVNMSFDVQHGRSWWKRRILAIGLTLVLDVAILLAFATIFWGGRIAEGGAKKSGTEWLFVRLWPFLRWGFLIFFLFAAVSLIYRVAPNLKKQTLVAVLPGAILAVVGWIAATFVFRFYIDKVFTSYTSMYGSLGAVIALLLWLYLTAVILLIGAEVNSEIRWAASESGSGDAREELKENRAR